MQESTARKRKAGFQTQDNGIVDDGKQTDRRQNSSGISKFFPLILLFAAFYALYQYSGPTRRVASRWLSQEGKTPRHLPGWSTSTYIGLEADTPKRDAIVEAFRHAWLAYERDAMGDDEYHPVSHKGSNLTEAGGIGYTVVDSIDSMLLMGLDAEYLRARDWIEHQLSFERDAPFNTFETTIRVLGGLLSAYHHSGGDSLFLKRARELADRMLPVFDTPSGLPHPMVNLQRREGVWAKDDKEFVSTAEASTLQLEFRYLSELTDEDIYWRKAERVMAVLKSARQAPGLASIFMDPREGRFVTSAIRLGSRGDSYYEYLLKQFIQTDRTEDVYREMYEDAVQAIHDHLIQKSLQTGLTYTAELIPERNPRGEISWRLTPKQDFLVCFFAGNLLLSATRAGSLVDDVSVPPRAEELSDVGRRDWTTGIELLRTCMATHDTKTGLAPEIAHFRIPSDNLEVVQGVPGDWYIKGARVGEHPPYDARYMLRPETVESLFIAFRLTGDKRYRDHGWAIFQAIEKHCRVPSGGYATIVNVDDVPVQHEDKMETFFLSETLKYLFLLFSDGDTIPLSKYVFNTEAHPLPIFTPSIRTGFT
ncbi:glycoside hydrolase family 47 protein [Russula ochroleuca]|uniref:alpha-1,2-Mannosidase n=1 Tax=Russula ochroleuca TaxID=152965 RepID=A0A9P5TA88_9AGAM|nr:glycoside hydrolase family 47 protein [Russula ochroleuca]